MQMEPKTRREIQKRQETIKFPRVVRLFGILGQLSPHSQVTIHSLAQEYNVSPRSAQRDVEALMAARLGVFYGENKTLRISRAGYAKIRSWLIGGE